MSFADKVLRFPAMECRNANARCKQCLGQNRCKIQGILSRIYIYTITHTFVHMRTVTLISYILIICNKEYTIFNRISTVVDQ